MASNPPTATLIAAFVPSGFGAKIRPEKDSGNS